MIEMMEARFHMALAVGKIAETKKFYVDFLGCKVGRKTNTWIDIDFFGHQITFQQVAGLNLKFIQLNSGIPLPHFGAIIPWSDWHKLKDKWIAEGVEFLVKPNVVFPGKPGEQMSMLLQDPDGYAIEFKSFEDDAMIFASKH